MKKHRSKINLLLFLLIAVLSRLEIYPENNISIPASGSNEIVHKAEDPFLGFKIKGSVGQFYYADNGIYYLKTIEEKDKKNFYLGFARKTPSEIRFEEKLPFDLKGYRVKKLIAGRGIIYLVGEDENNDSGPGSILYRININDMGFSMKEDVLDILLHRERPVLLEKGEDGANINVDGAKLPLSIKGDIQIKRLVDDRLLFISNGKDTEVVDIRTIKNLYIYSNKNEYLLPDKYNLLVQAIDLAGPGGAPSEEVIFYKVYVNGSESGRTETGQAGLPGEFKDMFEANRYYLIKLVRWKLRSAKKRYVRANNIQQPKPIRLFIPKGRVVKLELRFNGNEYSFTKSVLRR